MCYNYNPVISWFLTYHQSNTTSVTCGAGTANLPEHLSSLPVFNFLCRVLEIIVCSFININFSIVMSVLVLFTTFDYPFWSPKLFFTKDYRICLFWRDISMKANFMLLSQMLGNPIINSYKLWFRYMSRMWFMEIIVNFTYFRIIYSVVWHETLLSLYIATYIIRSPWWRHCSDTITYFLVPGIDENNNFVCYR